MIKKQRMLKELQKGARFHQEYAAELLTKFTKLEDLHVGNKMDIAAFLQRIFDFMGKLNVDLEGIVNFTSDQWVDLMNEVMASKKADNEK
jgi:hypothetical protein